ncbi:hypothetical protein [Formosa algae]|uniref:Uncharacterized protein n=1 Tax=Formosa algae TaxID=225843 RepID=A0A9X0YHI5_9FLAO|nr:hypothetical protein [Formosa algae]MBP1838672.1 hypothetical protein [Formosa algae]MDQ0335172.1 hypothetical protein [Formosa algae]OEI80423.1 hypothetical protein AST99_09465 [Formosa algae]
MKTQEQLLKDISEIVWTIENDYPEVYQYLDENPITIPNFEHPEVTVIELEEYLDSLNVIIENYKKEQRIK